MRWLIGGVQPTLKSALRAKFKSHFPRAYDSGSQGLSQFRLNQVFPQLCKVVILLRDMSWNLLVVSYLCCLLTDILNLPVEKINRATTSNSNATRSNINFQYDTFIDRLEHCKITLFDTSGTFHQNIIILLPRWVGSLPLLEYRQQQHKHHLAGGG